MEEEVVTEESKTPDNKKDLITKIVIAVVIIAVVVAIIVGIVNAVKSTPEKTVKKFIEAISKENIDKAYKLVDLEGSYVFENLYDYEDFKDEYEDIDDDWSDLQEDVEENYEEYKDEVKDYIEDLEDFSVELKTKKLKSKKVKGSGILYTVKAKIKVTVKSEDSSTERNTEEYTFYVMNKNKKYYIVGVTTDSGILFEEPSLMLNLDL